MKIENETSQDRADGFGASSSDEAAAVNDVVVPADGDVITLPPGASLEDLSVEGRDLVITLADGSRIVIPDGAVFVPQIVVEGVAVPPQTIAQLLTGNEPEPAAGTPQSSGGNFAGDEGEIQAAFDIGDLLPFTQLAFPEDQEEEIIPFSDDEPEVVIETPDNPAGVENAIATVAEDGLPARGNEPEGTQSESDSETTSGTIVFEATDGLSAILVNGEELTGPGQVFVTPLGELTITDVDLDAGEVGFTYTLIDNSIGAETDSFSVTVIDADGDEADATLNIIITDDGPIAADDLGVVASGSLDPITGDVLVNDEPGADGYAAEGAVQGFGQGDQTAAPGETIQGDYGTLTINADGTYTYDRDAETPGGVEESFEYTIVDQDGSTSSAVLVIQIEDAPAIVTNVPRIGEGTVVSEGALGPRPSEPVGSGEIADGDANNNSDPTEATGAVIEFNSPDGVDTVTLGGVVLTPGNLPQTVIDVATGTLVVTGFTYDPVTGQGTITYEYTLADNTSGDDTAVEVAITVTDLDGDQADDTLVINIIDDAPEAFDDSALQAEEGEPVTINVLANDIVGADDVQPGDIAVVDGSLSGTGTLVYNGDGTFTYTPAPGEEGEVTFDYSITDGDGDVSSATVTLELQGESIPEIFAEGDDVADEAGLGVRSSEPAGSDEPSNSEFASGDIFIDTGNDTIGSLVINGIDVTSGGTVTTAKGELTVTLANGSYSYTYELTDNSLTEPDSDTFSVVVTDSDGDTASTTIAIAILDDAPSAEDDAASLAPGQFGPIGGNVLGNDTQGADGASVTSYTGAGGTGSVGQSVQGEYGVLTIGAGGTYSYVRDPGTPAGVIDTFNYTITDGDGDTASANLVIAIGDGVTTLDLPVAGEDGTLVDEAGLAGPPAGSNAVSDVETTDGTFTFSAEDGPATVLIDGMVVSSVGQTFSGAFGVLEITAINAGSIDYSYTLGTATSGDNTSDSFVVRVEDQDDDFSQSTLEIAIRDDVPQALADSDSVTEDGPVVANGNVLTAIGGVDANASDGVADVAGADGASVTGVAFGAAPGDVSGQLDTNVAGAYGSLSLSAGGSYIYMLNNASAAVQGLDETESLTEVFTYTITDGDGDTATTTITITINGADDPVVINGLDAQGPEVVLDEDDLADGSSPDAGALTQSGSFTVDSGDGLSLLMVGGVPVFDESAATTYPVTIDDPVYGLLTITGVAPVTDAAGDVVSAVISYSYVLEDNSLLHSGGNDGSFTDSFAVVATDSDGSTDVASLDILIIDDAPEASDNAADVDEGGIVGGNVLSDDDGDGADIAGADGLAAQAVIQISSASAGSSQAVVDGSGNLVLTTALGTLTVDAASGIYSYASAANSTNTDTADVFTYTIVDADGDTSTAKLTINIDNAAGQVSDNGVLVNEAGLPFGSDPASTSETDMTGQITVVGASGTLVYNLLSPADGTFGTLTLNGDGSYSYTLDTPFTDTVAENGANVINGAESFDYEVRDSSGNLIGTGAIQVSIIDDVPTATDQSTISIAEDAAGLIGGNVLSDGTADILGADGASVTAITIGGTTTAVAQTGTPTSVSTANGTYTILPTGVWTFDPAANLDQSAGPIDAGFTYTLIDGDGDFDTADQPILITDGADPLAGPDISLTLDDANLADGSAPANPDFASETIAFTQGADDIVSIVFGASSGLGGGLDWVRVSDTEITGSDSGRLVVTLELSVTGTTATVTATLNGNFDDHPLVNADDLVDLGDVDVIASDSDGDTAAASVSVGVSDDLPTITAGTPATGALTVDETNFAVDAVADFSGLFTADVNADGPGLAGSYALGINAGATGLADTLTGEAVVLSVNGGVVEGRTSGTGELVFTVSVDATSGEVTLDQLRAVEHADMTDPNDETSFAAANLITLSASITDSDGDTASATANIAGAITFLDDGPSLGTASQGAGVSVDETDGFPVSATSTAPVIVAASDFGADGAGSTSYGLVIDDTASGLSTANGDFPITLVQTSAAVITGQFNDGNGPQTAFTATINSNGTVTLTQNVALEHQIDGDDSAGEHNDTLDLSGKISATIQITDGDGDTAQTSVSIGDALTFFDDGPSVSLTSASNSLSVSDSALSSDATADFSDAFSFDGGKDGLASSAYALAVTNGSDSGVVDVATGNSVFLFLESGVVVGREGADAASAVSGAIVFTATSDPDGVVELDQVRAVDHSASGTGTSVTLAADDLVQLIATATDNDGDTASQALNIGSDLAFGDDVPDAGSNAAVKLDDDALTGGNAGGAGDDADAVNVTGTLDAAFGADGGLIAFDLGSSAPAGFQFVTNGSNGVLIQQEQGGSFVTVVTVTLDPATGDYTVTQNANVLHPAANDENNTDFTIGYTVTDGDGDTAASSLTINVDDDTPTAVAANSTGTVDEDGLSGGISDNGSNDVPGADTSINGSVAGLFSAGADAPLTYALDPSASGTLPALTSGGVTVSYAVTATSVTATAGGSPVFTFTLDPDTGAWTFDLEGALDHAPGDSENAADIVVDFGGLLSATDADGDSVAATGQVAITIDDDTPRANNDTDAAIEGQSVTGNVLDGTGNTSGASGVDEGGADGLAALVVTSISSNNLTTSDMAADGSGNFVIAGEFGLLTLNQNGNYTYSVGANTIAADGTDTFTYTIIDNDGDEVSATITFSVDNVDLTGNNPNVTVAEEGLDTSVTGDDVAAGSVTGSAPAQTTETASGQVTVNGAVSYAIAGGTSAGGFTTVTGTFGTIVIDEATGEFTYTLTSPVTTTPAADDGATTEAGDTFSYTALDINGNATAGTITVNVIDDVPTASISAAGLSVSHDETFGIDADAQDVAGPIAALAGVTNTGDDPDVSGTVIGYALDASGLVLTGTVFGADGAGSAVFALNVAANGVDSGLDTTEGADILLYEEGGIVVGRVGSQSGEAAFAIAVDAATGAISMVQYLSIAHPVGGLTSPDEAVSIASGALVASVTVTDGDGDSDTATATIGDLISFQDDAGTLGGFTPITQTIANVADATAGGTFNYNTGSDGHAQFDISGPALTGVVYQPLFHGLVDATDDGIDNAAVQGTLLTATSTDGSEVLFTIAADVNGNYKYTLVTPDAGETQTVSLLGLTAGGPQPFVETPDMLIEFTGSGKGVNSSTQGFGIDNQFVGNGESFTIEFHSVGQAGDQAPLTNADFVSSFSLGNDNINGSLEITVTVYNDLLGTSEVIGPINVTGTSTLIDPVSLDTFNRVEVVGTGGSGQGVRFTSLDFTKNILPNDLDLDFDISAIDGDGDVTSTSTINVMVDASLASSASSGGTVSPAAFSTMQVLLEEPISVESASAINPVGTFSLQNTLNSNVRVGELTMVAAISGAVMVNSGFSAVTPFDGASVSPAAYEALAIDSGLVMPVADIAEGMIGIAPLELIESGQDFSTGFADYSGLSGQNALASSPVTGIGLQAEPASLEVYQPEGFDFAGLEPSAFFGSGSAGNVDQAMEALLAIEPGAPTAAEAGDLSAEAGAVFADLAIETALETLFDGLADGADSGNYLMAGAGAFDIGLLNQTVESSMISATPLAMLESQADEVAANSVAA